MNLRAWLGVYLRGAAMGAADAVPGISGGTIALITGIYTRLIDAIAGLALCIGLQAYLFGLTVALAGTQPNEFLFDTVLFAGFTLGVALPLVPVLVVGFVAAPLSAPLAAALVVAGVGLAGIGHVLYGRAVPRWRERYRE